MIRFSNGTRKSAFIGAMMVLAAPATAEQAAPSEPSECSAETCPHSNLVYFGSRGEGPGNGITVARIDPATGHLTSLGLAAEAVNPTWVIPSPHRAMIYAVSEVGNDGKAQGSVLSFVADPKTGKLNQISKVGSGGGGATHLTLSGGIKPPAIIVANYGSGSVGLVPLGQGGILSEPRSVQTETGSGPTLRQASAHPHGSAVDPSGRTVFVADLGADRIFAYHYDRATRALSAAPGATFALKPGSGPRHIVLDAGGRFAYVNAELTGEIVALQWNADRQALALVGYTPTRGENYAGPISSAELLLSADGRFLYVSNRGEDVMIVYAVNSESGRLQEIQRIASGGRSPVSFAIDPSQHWLVVANADSDLVSVFAVDPASGLLKPGGASLAVPHPASIAFLLR